MFPSSSLLGIHMLYGAGIAETVPIVAPLHGTGTGVGASYRRIDT